MEVIGEDGVLSAYSLLAQTRSIIVDLDEEELQHSVAARGEGVHSATAAASVSVEEEE